MVTSQLVDMRGIPAGFAIIDCQSCHGKNLPHFHFWPETEGKEILRLSAPQERPHVIHDQFEVFVILEISEVLVNVLVTSVISMEKLNGSSEKRSTLDLPPNMNKLVLVSN